MSITNPHNLNSWNLEDVSFSISGNARFLYFAATLRTSGTVSPRKISPSPYWPLAVWKNFWSPKARLGFANAFNSLAALTHKSYIGGGIEVRFSSECKSNSIGNFRYR